MEFGFFRGLPENLFILDIIGQVAFLFDIVLQFLLAYRDTQTYRMVYKRTPIALRSVLYLSSTFYMHSNYFNVIIKYNLQVDFLTTF